MALAILHLDSGDVRVISSSEASSLVFTFEDDRASIAGGQGGHFLPPGFCESPIFPMFCPP